MLEWSNKYNLGSQCLTWRQSSKYVAAVCLRKSCLDELLFELGTDKWPLDSVDQGLLNEKRNMISPSVHCQDPNGIA